MISISLCMIVKDEENTLARVLESVEGIADEIIIVDTGSTDKTIEIAEKFTDKIYHFDWINDFSAARNFAFSKATKDYQMWLDADDIILEKDREKIIKLKNELTNNVDAVTMRYATSTDKDGNVVSHSTRGRFFKRANNFTWNDPIHEYIPLSGNIYRANDIYITHKKEKEYTNRNILIYEEQVEKGIPLSPRSTYYFARELRDHSRHSEAITYFEKFLDDGFGWVEDNIGSCFALNICYKHLDEKEKALASLFRSFSYDTPRAEICGQIGYHFMDKQDFAKAAYWFELALTLKNPNSMGFALPDYWGYIPNLELSVCYCRLGDLQKSEFHNNKAKEFKPNSAAVLYNEEFFRKIKDKDTE